jgi:hypothetical protein
MNESSETERETESDADADADLDDMQLSQQQRRFLGHLPATRNELARELDVDPTTISYHRRELDEKGVRLIRDNHTNQWMFAGYQEFKISDSRLPDAPRLSSLQSIVLGFLVSSESIVVCVGLGVTCHDCRPPRPGVDVFCLGYSLVSGVSSADVSLICSQLERRCMAHRDRILPTT